jgi:hypothetical protein
VQFVSITADLGETENVGFAVRAVTGPPPHPAKIAKTGAIARNVLLTSAFFPRPANPFEAVNDCFSDICMRLRKDFSVPIRFRIRPNSISG